MATNEDLRPSHGPAHAGSLWLRVIMGVVAVTVALTSSLGIRQSGVRPEFLTDKLGAAAAAPSHVTAAGDAVAIKRSGYELRAGGRRVAISSADTSGSAWLRYERGAVRTTPFGEETVVVDGNVVEQFLTVTERTGPKRWRWRLETGALHPTARPDGSVLVTAGNVVSGYRILPAAILDEDGEDVTPAGTRWQLERRNSGWWLALDVDDRKLPLPYVIDPATITLRNGQPANNAGGASTLVITTPAGLAVDDQMIAQVTARGGTGTYICPPAGWTSVDRRNSTTNLAQEVFRKTAVAADVAAMNFTFTLDDTAGCASPTPLKASGGIIAAYGVDNSTPISAVNGQANASSLNIAAPTITPAANDILLGAFGTATGTTITAPTGTPTFTERWDTASTNNGAATRTTSALGSALATAGATGIKTAVAGAAAVNIGQLLSLRLDATNPTTPSLVVTESDADTHVSGTTLYYRAAGDGGSFDVTATTSDGQSGLKGVSFAGLTGGFTATSATTDTASPFANTYSWTGGATESGAKTVTAEDNATNQSSSTFTITPDNAMPTGGALTVNDVGAAALGTSSTSTGSFSISRTDYTDAGSGLVSTTLTRDSATYTNDACGMYSGSPTTIVGAPAQNLGVGCYRYVLTGLDNVGNTVSLLTDVLVHGAPTQLALSGSSATLTSGGTRILTARIQDAAGNTVTADNSTVVTFAQQSGVGTVSGAGTATTASGVTTKAITGALAGSVSMAASAAGLATGTLAAFTIVHGAAAQIALTHAGSTTSGDDHTLTATIRDAAGNTVTSDNSTVVTFAKTGGTGTATGLGNATASNGVAAKTIVNATAGSLDLDAQAAGLAKGTTSYVVTAGTGSTLTSTISASPSLIVANGTSTSAITVRLKDAAGNELNASAGTVALALSGAGSLSAVTDNGDGTYSAALTAPTTVGSATVTGALNGSALAATAAVTYVHGPAAQISLTESGSPVAGNAHTLTATIQDTNGNTITSDNSTVVTFAKSGGAGTVTGLGSATASNGVAARSVTNRLAGQIDFDAQAFGLTTATAGYTIATGPVSAAASDSTVVAAPAAVSADGLDTVTITVTLRDAGGNGIAGKTVTLTQGGGGSTITGGGATNASGVVTFSARDTSVGTVTYTATDTTDAITLADDATVNFTFSDGTAPTNTITLGTATRALLTGTTLYYNGAAGGSFTLSSAVADGGAGPFSATYPAVAQAGWTHGAETVTTPGVGPYVSSALAFAPGSSGDFTYDVSASDAWTPANSSVTTLNVTDDSTAPAAGILCDGAACAAGWYTASPVSVTLAAADAGAGLDQVRYTTDGTDPTIFTGTVYSGDFDVAAEGVTTVKYRAFDRIGNDTGVLTQIIRMDTVAPDTMIDSTPGAATQDTTPTFAFSSPEAGTTFQTRLDGGSWSTDTSPLTLGPLAENTYTLEVRATDVAANVDVSPASFTFTVDTTSADTTITSAPAAASGSTSASFSFMASDAGPGFECRLDGGAFTDCSSPVSYTGLTEAAHAFEVRSEDAAGNVDATPAAHAWTVDLTAPNTSFLATPTNPSASQTPTFGLGSSDPAATFECDLDGGGWTPCATPFATPPLGDGSHTLAARARDAAGNADASEVTFTWLVDATAPTGSITSPGNGADVSGTVVVTGNSTDGGSGVATVVFQHAPAGTGTWTPQAASWDTTLQADGGYDLRMITTDNAGNSLTSPVITVTVDNTDPTVSASAPNPVNLSTADPATVSATAVDAGTGIANVRFDQCAEDSPACLSDTWVLLGLDTGAPYQASWPIPADGPRLLRVRATDNAGRQSTELVLTTVDRTRPSGSLTAPAAAADLRGSGVALTANASDTAPGAVNTVTFQRSTAGAGSWSDVATDSSAPYSGTFDTTTVADGLYDLRVFTTDAAGNADATPATIQVRVDNTAPTGSVTAPAAGADVRGTIALTSNSADSGSGVATVVFQRSQAGAGTWTSQPSSFDTTAVADGQYDLRVITTDPAGNAFTSAALTVRVDNTAPSGSLTAPAAGAELRGTIGLGSDSADAGSGVATVQFQRSPAGAGTWTNQPGSFDTTAVADGLVDLRVVTTDRAGNTFASTAITIRIDNTVPTGSVTAPASGAEIGIAPVLLTSNSADPGGSGIASVVFERSPAGAGTWAATPASWNTASGPDAVADGSYELRVKTTDNAGNAFTSASITVLVDHTAPTTTASLAPGSPSNAPVTVSFSASDGAGSGVSVIGYRVDGGGVQQGAAVVVPAPGDNSNDGAHLVEFFSIDDVGNVESLQSVSVVIDTTAPSGAGGDPGDYLRGIANLAYSTAATDVSSVQFQFSPADAGAWSDVGAADIAAPYEASWNTTLVADAPYDLRVVVSDATGNVADTLLPGLPKTVDNTAPAGSVAAPAAGAYVSGPVWVDAAASDGTAPPASGVSAVRFEVKPSGAPTFSVFGTQTAPLVGSTFRQSLPSTGLADGPADLRVVVTDVAGNEKMSALRTINVDNDPPVLTFAEPGAAVGASVDLSATSSADTANVTFRYRPVGDTGSGAAIGSDTAAPFGVTWSTPPAAEQQWELIAVATDAGGNVTRSAPRIVLVDRTPPTGTVTAPADDATVGGAAVALGASAADPSGSGVSLVEWQVQEFGAASFSVVASDATAPYDGSWNSTAAAGGAAQIRARIVDAAGNERLTAAITVTVDSTGPSVTLDDPGAVLSGAASLSATTGGGATRVVFSLSPADAGTWTPLADDISSPFFVPFDTTPWADGLYDLRAIGYDALGNASAPAVREDVRLDNTAPQLVSAAPADGSVSTSASQIVLSASEPVTAPGAVLDGAPAPVPASSGNQLTFSTGSLTNGLHVLSGELEDAGGTRVPFRVAVTIESSPSADPPPVERSITASGDWTLTVPGGLVTVRMPQSAWPTPPTPNDYILVLRVDAGPGRGSAPGTEIADVTARWAVAGTYVTEFDAPIEILFSNPSGAAAIPAHSPDAATWTTIPPLTGPLPAAQRDGFTRSGSDVRVWTRHLTYFGLRRDVGAPSAPRDLAGVVADDGLTLRWVPATDGSGRLGNVTLYVNGESYREFGPTEFEAKLGPFVMGDTRSFTLAQRDAAGNMGAQTVPLRAVPPLVGLTLPGARAALEAAGFTVGTVTETTVTTALPGTVVTPTAIRLELAGTPIDLAVARSGRPLQTRLVFTVAAPQRVTLTKTTTVGVRLDVSKPARVTAVLRDATQRRLYHWRFPAKPGASVVKLRLPARLCRPGTYSLVWIARAGTETVSRTVTIRLVSSR